MSLTNYQLDKHLRHIRGFRGCFCRDELPARRKNGFYIINLDKSSEPGSHWTLLWVQPHVNLYVDSFGAVPVPEVLKFIHGPLYYSRAVLQPIKSSDCGRYVAYFISQLASGRAVAAIINDFSACGKSNDHLVEKSYSLT